MEQTLAYPIGLQDFRTLREEDYVYVDKTRYIAELIRNKSRYCFLERPRRFGKSLFLILGEADKAMKCMQAYFAGVDFKMKMDNENNFHNAFYLLMDLVGLETET